MKNLNFNMKNLNFNMKNMSIKWKLLTSFILVILFFGVATALMINGIFSIQSMNDRQNVRNQEVRLATELKILVGTMSNDQADVIVNQSDLAVQSFQDNAKVLKEMAARTAAMIDNPEEAAQFQSAVDGYIAGFDRVLEIYHNRLTLSNDELRTQSSVADRQSDEHKEVIYKSLDTMIAASDERFAAAQHEVDAAIARTLAVSGTLAAIAVLLAVALSLGVGFGIGNPLKRLAAAVQKVAEGDLTAEIAIYKPKDEVGQLTRGFIDMVSNLKSLIQQVSVTANEVASSSQQLTASAEESARGSQTVMEAITQVAAGAETQEKATEETSTAMDEMAAGVQKIAESTSTISETSQLTAEKAKDGGESIRHVIEQMVTIRSTVDHQVEVVTRLENKSNEISEIVGVITNIAKQTNLLALNASIEAARAGEHGKGFAVVAGEVRNLAEQSRESAEQITELIVEIQNEIREAVKAINSGSSEVQKGMGTVEKTGESFWAIFNAVDKVNHQIQEMSAIAEQMSAGSEEVAASVSALSNIAKDTVQYTQTMAAGSEEQMAIVEQISSSAAHLSKRASELQELIGKFKI